MSDAKIAMVIVYFLAESPWPNLTTRGSGSAWMINCPMSAPTKRKLAILLRSLASGVITPIKAEYGVLFAEYIIINNV